MQCPECGYQRGREESRPSEHWHVRLLSFGDDPDRILGMYMRHARLSLSEAKRQTENLPATIYVTENYREAVGLAHDLEKHGASTDYYRGDAPAYAEESSWDIFSDDEEEEKASSHRFPWLIIIIAALPVLMKVVPDFYDSVQRIWKTIPWTQAGETRRFEHVRVVVAAREIKAGETLEINDLKVITLDRETVPEHAVAPLNVSLLLGKRVNSDIQPNQIFTVNPCP